MAEMADHTVPYQSETIVVHSSNTAYSHVTETSDTIPCLTDHIDESSSDHVVDVSITF